MPTLVRLSLNNKSFYLKYMNCKVRANFKMVWYVLLRPLRPELDGQLDEFLYGRRTVEITTIVLLYVS
jgi:hypothetical protein